MVVSSGFSGHVIVSERSEAFLRSNGLITTAQLPINTLNHQQSQQPQQQHQQSIMQPSTNAKTNNNASPPARVILICHSNSHPFQKRNIPLEARQEIKVGRSVPRSRVEENNAIFDCKVLSRNHALIWYNDGKFLIKDTGSSNGTFINSQRIKSNEAYEISSGDVVQFGVDVIENSRKETHGCIIAVLKLIAPDGIEKTSTHLTSNLSCGSFDNDIYRLKQIMHESYLREILLEEKLVNLQKEVLATWKNSSNTWQAMIHEDLLLSRIDILENKLSCYQKNITNEKLQEQIETLQDEKEEYQKTAKDALKKVYHDRLAVIQKFTKFEQFWQASEDELMMLRAQLADSKEINDKLLLQEMNLSNNECIREQLAKQEADCNAIKEGFEVARRETDELKSQLQILDDFNDNGFSIKNEISINSDKNQNSTLWNKQQDIVHWLNNSDLRQLKDSDEIIHAMCNESKHRRLKIDPHQCIKLYDKLLDIEKRFSRPIVKSTTTKTTKTITTLDNKHTIGSDAMIISTHGDSTGIKTDKSSDDSNHNSENGENKVLDEIQSKENNANDVIVKEENQNTVDNFSRNDEMDLAVLQNVIDELKGVYNEFLAQMKLVQKDLIRAAKYDELESKLISTMLELQTIRKEHQRREQLLKLQNDDNHSMDTDMAIEKKTSFIKNNDQISHPTDHEFTEESEFIVDDASRVADNINVVSHDLKTELSSNYEGTNKYNHNSVSSSKTILESDLDDSCDTISISTLDGTNLSSTNSQITVIHNDTSFDDIGDQSAMSDNESFATKNVHVETINDEVQDSKRPSHETMEQNRSDSNASNNLDDYFDEKDALDTFDRIIEEESKLIKETDILREEEIIEVKERCVKLNDDNIALRREIDNLRLSSNKQFQMLLYTASLAAFIGYILSFFFS